MLKSYTNRQNAIRAARKALGAEAQPGQDFTLDEVEGGFTWSATQAELPGVERPPVEEEPDLSVEGAGDEGESSEVMEGEVSAPSLPTKRQAVDSVAAGVLGVEDLSETMRHGLEVTHTHNNLTLRVALETAFEHGRRAGLAGRRSPAPRAARAPGAPREGNKRDLVAKLLQRPEGTTTREILEVTGWPAVSVPQQAKASGLALRKDKVVGQPTRYFGTVPTPAV